MGIVLQSDPARDSKLEKASRLERFALTRCERTAAEAGHDGHPDPDRERKAAAQSAGSHRALRENKACMEWERDCS